jgi:hypothetical protein
MMKIINSRINGRSLQIKLSHTAALALNEAGQPLLAEMELIFGCMVRKRLRVGPLNAEKHVSIRTAMKNLYLAYRVKTAGYCQVGQNDDETLPEAPMQPADKVVKFTPKWLEIDYRRGQWEGSFGY